MKKKILLISFYFPPLASMGSIRMARFARFLPEFGWQPYVLTVKNATAGWPYDYELMHFIPKDIKITRVDPIFDLDDVQHRSEKLRLDGLVYRFRRFLSNVPPDGELSISWLPRVYLSAKKILATEQIDVIFTSSPPLVVHIVGLLLKREMRLPWVVDLRDAWSQHPRRDFSFCSLDRIDAYLERQVLLHADHVTTTTRGHMTEFLSRIAKSQEENLKFTTITNGFDNFDNNDGNKSKPASVTPNTLVEDVEERFNITFTGTLYGGVSFLTALTNLLTKGDIPAKKVEFTIVGLIRPIWSRDGTTLLEKLSRLGSIVRKVGWISQREVRRYILQADVLLLVLDHNRDEDSIPGKTFEYIRSRKPILALVPADTEVASLIKQTNGSIVVAPNDVVGIEKSLRSLYRKWEKRVLVSELESGELKKYDARELTKSLTYILDSVSD